MVKAPRTIWILILLSCASIWSVVLLLNRSILYSEVDNLRKHATVILHQQMYRERTSADNDSSDALPPNTEMATRQDMLPNHFGPEDTVYAMSPEKHGFLAHLRFYLGCPTITPPI
eukprot:Platyproteum_vivax@DN6742_c0_g1_i1.p1